MKAAELRDQVMRLRMISVAGVFRKHVRTVRDLAASLGKRARLELDGEGLDIAWHVRDRKLSPLQLGLVGLQHGIGDIVHIGDCSHRHLIGQSETVEAGTTCEDINPLST